MKSILLLNLVLDLFLAQSTFTIIGSVRNQSGQAVDGVRVSVMDENFQSIRTLFVDSSGRFTVRGLRQGRFTFRVETTGTPYEEQTQQIELQAPRVLRSGNETFPLDIVLKFKKGKESGANNASVFAQEVPAPARKEYESGVKLLKSQKTDQAIASLKMAIEIFPDYYDALELLGVEFVKSSQHEAALPLLSHALRLNKRGVKSLYGLGVAYLNLNRLAEAIEQLEGAAQLNPNNPNTQMMLGLAYGNSRLFDKSENAFKKALQLGGVDAAEAHFYLAGLYNKQGKYQQARRELELLLKQSKNLKDPAQIKAMIEKLKEKEKTQGAAPTPQTDDASPPGRQAPSPESSVVSSREAGPFPPISSSAPVETKMATPAAETKLPEPEPVPPLPPEFTELIRQSALAGAAMHKRLLDYTYTLKKTRRVLDDRGHPTQIQEQVFEAYPVRGEHVLIRLSADGVPSRSLAEDRKRAVQQLEEAELRRASEKLSERGIEGEAEGYVSAGISGAYNGKAGYVSINISAFLQYCEFFDPKIENIAQRPTVVICFRPGVGSSVQNNYSYVSKLVGKVWIDQSDQIVIRVEAWPVSAFDLVSSTATNNEATLIYQQERQPNGLWFPTLIRANARGRADILNGLNWDVVFEFDNYQQFKTSASEKIDSPSTKKN
jgi:tetratricopeptide (TPR) repeat protein